MKWPPPAPSPASLPEPETVKSPAHQFVRLKLSGEVQQRELLYEILWELESLGFEETESPPELQIEAFFPAQASPRQLASAVLQLARLRGTAVKELDAAWYQFDPGAWLAKFRQEFHGFEIGPDLFIHPSWEPPSAGHRVNILLDPGQAFGTGTHESTQLCLLALREKAPEARVIVDVGTGSGILSIAAAKFNPQALVFACDIDPQVLPTARQNLRKNSVPRVHLLAGEIDALRGAFDLVANLSLEILRQKASSLASHTGRDLIVSGFTVEQSDGVREALERSGPLHLHRSWKRNGWCCLLLHRDGPSTG